jgi:ubiquinone/menaquinone biosynthesis C-methylase UbiE
MTHAPEPRHVPTREGYDLWSSVYDSDANPLVALEEPHVDRLLGNVAGLRVADVGCGTGRHAVRLAQRGAEVTALDFSPGMLARAKEKDGADRVRFITHDIARPLPLTDASFDRVLCALVLDHVADVPALFSELARICRPAGAGGCVVVSVMHPAMTLRGVQARFTDPATGVKTYPASVPNRLSHYVMGALQAGLCFTTLDEHDGDEELAQRVPRLAPYVGWPMLVTMAMAPA